MIIAKDCGSDFLYFCLHLIAVVSDFSDFSDFSVLQKTERIETEQQKVIEK